MSENARKIGRKLAAKTDGRQWSTRGKIARIVPPVTLAGGRVMAGRVEVSDVIGAPGTRAMDYSSSLGRDIADAAAAGTLQGLVGRFVKVSFLDGNQPVIDYLIISGEKG